MPEKIKDPMMKRILTLFVCALTSCLALGAVDPFKPDAYYTYQPETKSGTFTVTFMMTEGQHIYDDMMMCSLGEPTKKPAQSSLDTDGRIMYSDIAEFQWQTPPGVHVTLGYQGCDALQCYMPQETTFTITSDSKVVEGALPLTEAPAPTTPPAEVTVAPDQPVEMMRSTAGFLKPEAFLSFLRNEINSEPTFFDNPKAWVAQNGVLLMIAVVFLFGIALNLTPCVLPMMPINLAIIGAGAAGGSRLKGALRGGAYGLGIALAYGILALIPAITGTAFGTLQAAWWFNAIIALIFVALALALLDVFMIDFTRFSSSGNSKQGTIAAFIAGVVSAILAGACVALVLIAVLLLTGDGFANGQYWMLCLPFVLGLGMALPWPFAGAGLSFLPKPGAWMVWVKKIFALIIFGFAAWYGWTAWKCLSPEEKFEEGVVHMDGADLQSLEKAIERARADGKPVFLDFWGTACKACDEMDAKTFTDPTVKAELARFTFIKVKMDLSDRAIQPTQEAFHIQGLPTYIVIE